MRTRTINISEFKPCKSEPPKESGHYLVIRMYNGRLSYAAEIEYTVEYGWNTFKLFNGECRYDSAIDYDDDSIWAEVTEPVEDNENDV